jgi:hypothetical protein
VDSAHFSSHEKRSYPTFAYTGKHLANYSQRLSIISKQSKLIPKELRYQEKVHAIICYAKRKEKSCKFSPFFLFIIKKNAIWKNIICKARSNLMMPIQKTVARPAFFVFSKKYLQNSLKRNKGKNKLVPRLHSKHTNIPSKSASNQT